MKTTILDINKIEGFKEVYIYGAGFIGKLLYNLLVKEGICIESIRFVTTNGGYGELFGKPIENLAGISGLKEEKICIVAVREDKQDQIKSVIDPSKFEEIVYLDEKTIQRIYAYDLSFSSICENNGQNSFISTQVNNILKYEKDMQSFLIRKMTRKVLNFEVQVTEHCNLNCAGCDHFSPIADEEFLDVEKFEKDMKRLSELSDSEAGRIKLLGGEPLLHPDIIGVMKISRKYFPDAYIEIVTNGILVLKMDSLFWEVCRENRINISITKYPIKLDFDAISSAAEQNGVNLQYINDEAEKTLWKLPMDETGAQDPSMNFYKCWRANECISFDKGRIYGCVIPAHIQHLNNAFEKHIPVKNGDYIDIYEAESINEILEFLSKPMAFCRYCNLLAETNNHPWRVSKKEASEWT